MTTWLVRKPGESQAIAEEGRCGCGVLETEICEVAGLGPRAGRWRAGKVRVTTPITPYIDRPTLRASNLYGTAWRAFHDDHPQALTSALSFGRLESFYRASVDQLPTVVATRPVEAGTVRCHRWGKRVVANGRLWREFAPERHQIVYSSALRSRDPEDLVQRLIYRADLPFRPEFASIAYPGELNWRPHTTGAVGPHVSVLCGHQNYVENAAFVSAVQAVASSVRLREIRNPPYRDLREFNVVERDRGDTRSRRRVLEKTTDDLTRLAPDHSVSVEAPADLGVLVPSLRIVEYHTQVYSSIGIRQLAETVSRMLRRLEAKGRAELTSVESIERRVDEDRRLRWAIGVGFVSVVAIPISLLLASLGVNASQVDARHSMFDAAYPRCTWGWGCSPSSRPGSRSRSTCSRPATTSSTYAGSAGLRLVRLAEYGYRHNATAVSTSRRRRLALGSG